MTKDDIAKLKTPLHDEIERQIGPLTDPRCVALLNRCSLIIAEHERNLAAAVMALDWLYRNASSKYPVRDLDESIENARLTLATIRGDK